VSYLLDTNVLSELRKKNCEIPVRSFVDKRDEKSFCISAVSIGEITLGVERLPPGRRKTELSYFLDTQLPEQFEGRIIPLDDKVMREWGRICVRAGRTLPLLDSLIAASALVHSLTILTRNLRDFEGIEGLLLVNPWEEEREEGPGPKG
jgi:predicted nucleic acid-binding protein